MAEYQSVQKGSLKLKCDSGIKKKKKKKESRKVLEQQITTTGGIDGENSKTIKDKRTKAEMSFESARQKKNEMEILNKASKTHKERIMEFNEHLDNLTEHFDIPKVSWTK